MTPRLLRTAPPGGSAARGSAPRADRVLLAAVLLAGVVSLGVGPAASLAAQPLPRHLGALAVETRPGSPMTAVSVGVPAGSAMDPEDREGTAWVLGHALGLMADSLLGLPEGTVDVRVDRNRSIFTVLVPGDGWRDAAQVLSRVLFELPVEEWAVDRAREVLLHEFAFEHGAPVREFEEETFRTLTSALDPWALPIRGFPRTVSTLEREELRRFHRTRYARDRGAAAVVGPVPEDAVVRGLPAASASTSAELRSVEPHALLSGPRADRLTWLSGDRVALVREVTSTWIGVGLPAPRGASWTALELLARVLEERLNPSPPDPGIYRAEVSVQEAPEGPLLLVRAATAPEGAERWEAEILETVEELARSAPHDSFFRAWRERFRTRIALREMHPEERTRRWVADLLRDGRVRSLPSELDALGPQDLHRLAAALGEARILVLGPDLGDGD